MSAASTNGRKRQQRQRGLSILRWAACLCLLSQLLGGLLLDYLWIRPRNPRLASMLASFHARQHAPEIIFLGSSRFCSGLDCSVMDAELRHRLGETSPRTFNACQWAGDPTVYDRVLGEMIEDGYRPSLVVLEIDPPTLSHRDRWLHQHALNVLDWRDVPEAAPALCMNHRIMYLIRSRLLPLYLHRYHICKCTMAWTKSLISPSAPPQRSDPPIPVPIEEDPQAPELTDAVRQKMDQDFRDLCEVVRDYRVGGVVAQRLERLLQRCQSANIPVLMVGVPVSSPSRRACTPEVTATFLAHMRSLTERYPCASYTDWRDQLPDNFFMDGHHVNQPGSIFFSRCFAARELAPLWQKP